MKTKKENYFKIHSGGGKFFSKAYSSGRRNIPRFKTKDEEINSEVKIKKKSIVEKKQVFQEEGGAYFRVQNEEESSFSR